MNENKFILPNSTKHTHSSSKFPELDVQESGILDTPTGFSVVTKESVLNSLQSSSIHRIDQTNQIVLQEQQLKANPVQEKPKRKIVSFPEGEAKNQIMRIFDEKFKPYLINSMPVKSIYFAFSESCDSNGVFEKISPIFYIRSDRGRTITINSLMSFDSESYSEMRRLHAEEITRRLNATPTQIVAPKEVAFPTISSTHPLDVQDIILNNQTLTPTAGPDSFFPLSPIHQGNPDEINLHYEPTSTSQTPPLSFFPIEEAESLGAMNFSHSPNLQLEIDNQTSTVPSQVPSPSCINRQPSQPCVDISIEKVFSPLDPALREDAPSELEKLPLSSFPIRSANSPHLSEQSESNPLIQSQIQLPHEDPLNSQNWNEQVSAFRPCIERVVQKKTIPPTIDTRAQPNTSPRGAKRRKRGILFSNASSQIHTPLLPQPPQDAILPATVLSLIPEQQFSSSSTFSAQQAVEANASNSSINPPGIHQLKVFTQKKERGNKNNPKRRKKELPLPLKNAEKDLNRETERVFAEYFQGRQIKGKNIISITSSITHDRKNFRINLFLFCGDKDCHFLDKANKVFENDSRAQEGIHLLRNARNIALTNIRNYSKGLLKTNSS